MLYTLDLGLLFLLSYVHNIFCIFDFSDMALLFLLEIKIKISPDWLLTIVNWRHSCIPLFIIRKW